MHMEKIVLLVLDEAPHCFCSHPANGIMQNFFSAAIRERRGELPKYPRSDGQPSGGEETGRSATGDCRNAGLSWLVS